MSEVKGTLLGIVLAISVFSIVFGIITLAVKDSADTVSSRMSDTASQEQDVWTSQVSTAYNLAY